MGRVTSAAPHLSAEEIAQRLKETVGTREHRRWLIIWNALVAPRTAKEIAKHTGVAENTVHDLVRDTNDSVSKLLKLLDRASVAGAI